MSMSEDRQSREHNHKQCDACSGETKLLIEIVRELSTHLESIDRNRISSKCDHDYNIRVMPCAGGFHEIEYRKGWNKQNPESVWFIKCDDPSNDGCGFWCESDEELLSKYNKDNYRAVCKNCGSDIDLTQEHLNRVKESTK